MSFSVFVEWEGGLISGILPACRESDAAGHGSPGITLGKTTPVRTLVTHSARAAATLPSCPRHSPCQGVLMTVCKDPRGHIRDVRGMGLEESYPQLLIPGRVCQGRFCTISPRSPADPSCSQIMLRILRCGRRALCHMRLGQWLRMPRDPLHPFFS